MKKNYDKASAFLLLSLLFTFGCDLNRRITNEYKDPILVNIPKVIKNTPKELSGKTFVNKKNFDEDIFNYKSISSYVHVSDDLKSIKISFNINDSKEFISKYTVTKDVIKKSNGKEISLNVKKEISQTKTFNVSNFILVFPDLDSEEVEHNVTYEKYEHDSTICSPANGDCPAKTEIKKLKGKSKILLNLPYNHKIKNPLDDANNFKKTNENISPWADWYTELGYGKGATGATIDTDYAYVAPLNEKKETNFSYIISNEHPYFNHIIKAFENNLLGLSIGVNLNLGSYKQTSSAEGIPLNEVKTYKTENFYCPFLTDTLGEIPEELNKIEPEKL